MTEFEKFLNTKYARNLDEIQKGVTLQASEAFSRINEALGQNYSDIMDELEAHYCDKAFQGYKRGFKDGIKFIMKMSAE